MARRRVVCVFIVLSDPLWLTTVQNTGPVSAPTIRI